MVYVDLREVKDITGSSSQREAKSNIKNQKTQIVNQQLKLSN